MTESHRLNEGRESLWTLDKEKLYLVEGDASGEFSTMKEGVSRYALANVLIRPYTTDIQYAEIPVVAYCDHLNCIRKQKNIEHLNWVNGRRHYFVGKVEEYETKGVQRRSMKVFVDANLPREHKLIEKRIRSLSTSCRKCFGVLGPLMLPLPSRSIVWRSRRVRVNECDDDAPAEASVS